MPSSGSSKKRYPLTASPESRAPGSSASNSTPSTSTGGKRPYGILEFEPAGLTLIPASPMLSNLTCKPRACSRPGQPCPGVPISSGAKTVITTAVFPSALSYFIAWSHKV